jgi:histidinol-phosphatase
MFSDDKSMPEDLQIALKLADISDEISIQRYQAIDLVIETKPDFTPVSDADRAVEQAIRDYLSKYCPGDAIIGEEFGSSTVNTNRSWIIDPIDGTKNFIRGVPVWATLIALRISNQMQVGVVSAPALGRRWYASWGYGAYVIDNLTNKGKVRKLSCSKVSQLSDASMSVSSFDKKDGWQNLQPNLLKLSEQVWRNRGYGDFWSHLLVAEGAIDFALEPQLALWDMAALEAIVCESGGRFSNFAGIDGSTGPGALSSNRLLHDLVLTQLK